MSTETQARPLATAAPIGALQLSAKDSEQAFLLPQGPTSIGAGPKCDLRLDAPGLKPLHCVIVLQTDGVTVRRWSPGTKLNGSTFTEAPLAVGDCLSIGPVDLHVSEAEIDASERELPEWSVGELGDELSRDTEDPQESVPQMERSVLGTAAGDQESKDTSVSEPSRLLDTTFDDESVSANVSSEDSAEGWAATEDSLVPHDASTVDVLDAPLEEAPTSDASEVKCRAEESGASDLWEDFSIADSDVESASPKTDQAMARDAAAPPIPPHLLKPWEDAHRPGVSDESCDLSSCEDEVALIGDAWTEGNNLPASLLFASPVGEESENPHEGESTEPESEEGLSDEGTSAAGIDAPHEYERPDANPVVDEDDPEGFEFYTDVNWQSVDAGAAKEVGHAQSEAGSGIPTPHPINLAAILRGQEQLAAVRARAKQLVHTLRAERGAGAASREELSVFKNRCEELAACVDDLKTSLAERDEQYAGLEAEKLALDGELAELREAVSSQSTVNQELRDQLAEQAEKIASLSTAIENWESERTALNRELTSAREQLELQATPTPTPTAHESGNDGLLEATSGSKVDHAPGEERDEDHVDQPAQGLTDPGLPSETNKSVSTADVWSFPIAETEPGRSSSELDEILDPPNDTPLQDTTRDWTTALPASSSGATDVTAAADEQEPFVSGKTTPLWATNKPKVEAGAALESHWSERATPAEASDEWTVPTDDTDVTRDAGIVPAAQGSHEASPATQWGQDASEPEPASRIEPAIDPAGLWDIERSAQQESIDDAPSTDQAADAVWGIRPAEDAAAATREAAPTPTAAEHAPTASESTHTEPPVWGNQAEIQDERSTAPPVSAADPSWDGSSRVEATDEPVATVNEEPAPAFEMPHESSGEASDAGPTGASPIPDWLLDDSDDDEDGAAPESAASDEDPAPAFEAPKSFLEQYAHLLPAEDEPAQDEPVPGVPATAVALPAAEPEAESTSADPDEEDIDAYMSRLMERMRGGGEAAANASSAVSPPQLDDEAPSVSAPEPETPASPVKPMLSLDEIKRSVQPEQSTDMASLRRLANDSARQAIGVAASKHSREQSIANLVIATIAMASGGYLIASAPAIFSAQLVGGAFALLLAGVWVFRSVAHLLQSVRTGDHDGALQQRLNAEKLPINK